MREVQFRGPHTQLHCTFNIWRVALQDASLSPGQVLVDTIITIAAIITIVIVISINIIKWPSGLPIPDSPFDHGGLVLLRARDLQLDLLDPFEGGAASTRQNMLTSPRP